MEPILKRKAVPTILVVALLILSLGFGVQRVKASDYPTITIKPDGSIEPPAPISIIDNVYTLTDDISASIVVQRDNIIIDGAGHTVDGPGFDPDEPFGPVGIRLEGAGVTIKNCHVINFWAGFHIFNGGGNTLQQNTANYNYNGFVLLYSSGNILEGNTANNNTAGFVLYLSNNNHLKKNTAEKNTGEINEGVGFFLWDSSSNTIVKNTACDNDVDAQQEGACTDNVFKKNKFDTTIGI